MNKRLKKRIQADFATIAKVSQNAASDLARMRCECGHPFYVHNRRGNCGECPINPRTNKSRCRRFKAAS